MRESDNEITKKLIQQIRDVCLRGQSDTLLYEGRSDKYMHDVEADVYWQTAGCFLLIYTESLENNNAYYYRLYKCSGDAAYDRRLVLNRALENENFRCIFDLREIGDNRDLMCFQDDGAWYEEYEEAVSDLLNLN